MGHHLDPAPAARSAEIYARDASAPALKEAVKSLHHIQQGTFVPDNTRSGRFVKVNKPTDVPDDAEGESGSETSSGLEPSICNSSMMKSFYVDGW